MDKNDNGSDLINLESVANVDVQIDCHYPTHKVMVFSDDLLLPLRIFDDKKSLSSSNRISICGAGRWV